MALMIVIVCILVIGYFYLDAQKTSDNSTLENSSGLSSDLKNSLEQLQRVMNKCQQEHEHAVCALIWLASSDGTISRQEFRVMISFCTRQGTQIEKLDLNSIDKLNSGLNMKISGGENAAIENIAMLKIKSIQYRAAFLGATEAICSANKTINSSKKRFQQAARDLIAE